VAVTLVALYAVMTQASRERFTDGDADTTNPAPTKVTSGAAASGVVDAHEAERIDGMVFKAYMDAFGVPPTPPHSKHYASVVNVEKLDEAALKERIRKMRARLPIRW
jgi:hypothetical protein